MAAPQAALNKSTHSVGFHAKLAVVRSVTEDGLHALTVDRQNTETRVPMLVQRSKGPLPAVGETWLIDQALGAWMFAAFVGRSPTDFAASSPARFTASAAAPPDPAAGDVWLNESGGNGIFRWNGSSWTGLQFGAVALADGSITPVKISPGAGIAPLQIGSPLGGPGAARIFTGPGPPAGASEGDLWVSPGQDNGLVLLYGGNWVPLQTGALAVRPGSLTASLLIPGIKVPGIVSGTTISAATLTGATLDHLFVPDGPAPSATGPAGSWLYSAGGRLRQLSGATGLDTALPGGQSVIATNTADTTGFLPLSATFSIPGDAAVGSIYRLKVSGTATWAATTAVSLTTAVLLGAANDCQMVIAAGQFAAGASVTWSAEAEVAVTAVGSGGTCNIRQSLTASAAGSRISTAGGAGASICAVNVSSGLAMNTTVPLSFAYEAQWSSVANSPAMSGLWSSFERAGP